MTGVEFVRELFRLDVSDYDFDCRCTTYDMIQLMQNQDDELRKRRVVCKGCFGRRENRYQ